MLIRRREGFTEWLILNRAQARNALSRALVAELLEALASIAADDSARVVVLASALPTVFLAGGDLNELGSLPMTREGAEQVLELGKLTRAVEALPVPVIAAVSAPALGGGAEVTVTCDFIVMAREATIRFVHARMGLVPAWGGATRLEERVGATRAADLLLTARPVGANEALACGLANRVGDDAHEVARTLADELAATPREALVALKRTIVGARVGRRGAALDIEREAFRAAWGSPPHRAAFEAVARKRSGGRSSD